MPDSLLQFEYMSLDDFEELLLDKPENEKWELIGGRIIRGMVGARWEHKQIILNLTLAINNHLRTKKSGCRAYDESFWLKEKSLELGVFPDIIVFCSRLESGQTSINDPLILIEVVSKGSEARDRVEKWGMYQKLPSLQHYVMVSRDKVYVELFNRQDADWRGYEAHESLDATFKLPAIDFKIALADIYWDVLKTEPASS